MPSAYELPAGGVNRAARWARPFNRHANGVRAPSSGSQPAASCRAQPVGLAVKHANGVRAETVLSNVDAECVRTASRRVSARPVGQDRLTATPTACALHRAVRSQPRPAARSPLGLRLNMPTACAAETVLSNVDAECVRTASRRVRRTARWARPFNRHANGVRSSIERFAASRVLPARSPLGLRLNMPTACAPKRCSAMSMPSAYELPAGV